MADVRNCRSSVTLLLLLFFFCLLSVLNKNVFLSFFFFLLADSATSYLDIEFEVEILATLFPKKKREFTLVSQAKTRLLYTQFFFFFPWLVLHNLELSMLLFRGVLVALILLALLLGSAAEAHSASPASTDKQLQRQRLHAFAKYAERVGTALDLLLNGPVDGLEDAAENDGVGQDGHAQQQQQPLHNFNTPLSTDHAPFATLVQCIQYPHKAVQLAVRAVTAKAAAARALASVLSNSKLSAAEEARLAQMRATADDTIAFSGAWSTAAPPSSSPAVLRRARAATAMRPTASRAEPSATETDAPRRVSTLADTPNSNSFITCVNGYVSLDSSTPMHCAATGTTTVGAYMSVPEADRETCSIVLQALTQHEQQCVCPVDAVLIQHAERAFECATRPVEVQVLLDDNYLCKSSADAVLGLPSTMESEYCVKTTRHAKLSLEVRWKYTYVTLDALRAAADTSTTFVIPSETPPSSTALQWVVMGVTPPSGVITTEKGTPYAKGSYSELKVSTDLFEFLSPITAESQEAAAATGVDAFYISSKSSLYQAYAFSAVFCFSAPRKTQEHLVETPLSTPEAMTAYFGSVNGTTAHTLRLDLSTVSDTFVEGNQMYVETGVRGGSSAYTYRVARLHISFTDLAVPSEKTHHYTKQFNPLYILLIVAIAAVVVGAGLAVLWYYLMQDEEYDDRMVSDAQRKKRQGKGT